MFQISEAKNASEWDSFLASLRFRPFLQSWTMGEVYRSLHQVPVRLEMRREGVIVGICFAHLVEARRGRHLSIPYGPLFSESLTPTDFETLLPQLTEALREFGRKHQCSFVRLSPFLPAAHESDLTTRMPGLRPSPMHLLAEHLWYLPLYAKDPWTEDGESPMRPKDELFAELRKTTRNLVRRAEKDGVTIEASPAPMEDVKHFITLHDETRKRHGFTPYTNVFFRAQVEHFAKRNECTVYLAHYQGNVIASSIHMHAFGETSYHHGASADAYKKIPASYLLQWTAIEDAIKRGDRVYNFWGIAPQTSSDSDQPSFSSRHPFAGVTLFKTGFGGKLLTLTPCQDLPLSSSYTLTRAFETFRKWKRGF